MFFTKSIQPYLFTLITAVFIAGCNDSISSIEEEPVGIAQVRFIHSAASQKELDIRIQDKFSTLNIYLADQVTYSQQRGYFNVYDEERILRVFQSGTNIVVAEKSTFLEADKAYTVIATDLATTINPELIILKDTTATPIAGSSLVRFVHASSDAPTMNIISTDSTLSLNNLLKYNASTYFEMNEGTFQFNLYNSITGEIINSISPKTFISGNRYTVVISGSMGTFPGPEINAQIYQEIQN